MSDDDQQDDTAPLSFRPSPETTPPPAPPPPVTESPRQRDSGSWMPPTAQAAPGQWSGFVPEATYPVPSHPAAPPQQQRGRVSGWVWPVVCVLALMVGLVGGAVGGAVYDAWQQPSQDGLLSGGLSDAGTVTTPPLPASNGSVAAVATHLLPSTIQVLAQYQGHKDGATGSGFVLDRRGHYITNNHVVADAVDHSGPIEIMDRAGNRYDATVVGRSPTYDIAVLFVKGAPSLPPASLGTAKALRVGEQVVAFGSPLGLSSTVTSGIVSALDRPVTTSDASDSSYINAVQTDAAINPGNSGGPLVNLRGQVVGMNSAIATTGGSSGGESGSIGVGFAIPIDQVKITADQILRSGSARYPVIGASVTTGGQSSGTGAEIQDVTKGTPAEDAGLRKGDVVTALDGDRVTDGIALIVAIRSHQPGETVDVKVVRGERTLHLSVTLDSKRG